MFLSHTLGKKISKINKSKIIGYIFILAVLILNQFTWSVVFDDDGLLSNSLKVSFFLIDLFLLTVGIIFLKNYNNKKYLKFSIVFFLISIIIIESILTVIDKTFLDEDKKIDKRAFLSPYIQKKWANDYFIEFHALEQQYTEFLGWSRKKFKGDYINIDSVGIRKSWNQIPSLQNLNNKQKSIFLFGGSTLWGTGARDDYTIPSILAKKLSGSNYRFEVTNFGESGYVFMQSIIKLILLLKDGERPDYVIFYQGVNDVYLSYQGANKVQMINTKIFRDNLVSNKEIINKKELRKKIREISEGNWSRIHKSFNSLYNLFFPAEGIFTEEASNYNDLELEKLANEGVKKVFDAAVLLEKISKMYNFEYLIFWQPVIFIEKNINEEESSSDIRIKDKNLEKYYQLFYEKIKEKEISNFYDISGALKNRNKTLYIDFCHLSEEGTRIVADKIYSLFYFNHLESQR